MHGRSGCLVLLYISLEASPLRYASTQVSLFVDTLIKFAEEWKPSLLQKKRGGHAGSSYSLFATKASTCSIQGRVTAVCEQSHEAVHEIFFVCCHCVRVSIMKGEIVMYDVMTGTYACAWSPSCGSLLLHNRRDETSPLSFACCLNPVIDPPKRYHSKDNKSVCCCWFARDCSSHWNYTSSK